MSLGGGAFTLILTESSTFPLRLVGNVIYGLGTVIPLQRIARVVALCQHHHVD